MTLVSKSKPDRHRIDLSDGGAARQWTKKLGRSKDEIAAAIAKVGDNCETVRKELGCDDGKACAPAGGVVKVAT